MNVISAVATEFATFAKVSDGTDTAILEFSNTPILGLHEFKRSVLTDEDYEALGPSTDSILELQIALENTSVNMSSLFASYNA
jgi:hypothetical protein